MSPTLASEFSSTLPLVCVCACVRVCESLSRVQLYVTPWTVAHQAPLSMEFSGKNTE